MQTRELIILLLLILLAAVVIALVVRRGNAKRAEEDRAEARQMGTQAAWLGSADETPAAAAGDASSVSADDQGEAVPMTRAERREAREAAEGAQTEPEPAAEAELEPAAEAEPLAENAAAAGAAWAGGGPETDPDAEKIAQATGFRDEVAGGVALSEDIAIPANEWGGPREEALVEEPTVTEAPAVEEPAGEEPATEDALIEEPTVENPVEDDLPEDALVEEPTVAETTVEKPAVEHTGRRISGFLELRDGGFGVGSAAPIEDGAQPLDHPVQAYRDTMTFRAPGDPGYDSAEPDVWFYDAGAAERSGFRPADG